MSINQRAKDMGVSDLVKRIEKLEEENKKLKLENADLMGERDGLQMVVEKLNKENQTLESDLDKAHTAYRAVRKVNRELMNGYV